MTKTITLPRSVVEQALEALNASMPHNNDMAEDWPSHIAARRALRAALEQQQDHSEQHLDMVPAGWKLVPVEPTDDMLYDIQEYSHILPPRGRRIWAHMLAAAPQPPTVKESLTVRQQVEQEPVAWVGVGSVTWDRRQSEKVEKLTRKAQPEYGFVIPLYTHPQPPRQPLTKEEISVIAAACGGLASDFVVSIASAIEVAHGIGGEK